MKAKTHIPFQDLVTIVKQLSPTQKARLHKELAEENAPQPKRSRLTELLLNGPVFSDEQIKIIEENRKSIDQWRKKS